MAKSTLSRLLMGGDTSAAAPISWQLYSTEPEPGLEIIAPPSEEIAPEPPPPPPDDRLCRDEQHLQILMEQQARIRELEKELESRPRQAYQQGYSEGQSAGLQQATARVDPVLVKLAHSIQDLVTVRKRHLVEAEEDAVKLAVAVARRILHRELAVDPDSLLGVVKATIGRVDSRDVHRIRVHPDDVAALQRHLAALNLPPRVEVSADRALERGGVIVETSRGSMDASISSQLAEIENGLVDIVRRSG
jgi:flagellar assembly protein FliH